jgi:ElaB/YqjD/DUF883 family membrane-anchored ribosome-binding protein
MEEHPMSDIGGSRRETASERAQHPASEQMGDAAKQGMDRARELGSSVAEQAGEAWRTARDAAPQYADQASRIARDVYDSGQRMARQVGGQVPVQWTTLLIGAAIGYFAGYMIHSR